MKKFILFVLALTLLCTSSLCAYAENAVPERHTIWGIPFGTSEEDFVKLAYEKSGFVFTLDDKSTLINAAKATLHTGSTTIKEDPIYYVDTSKQKIPFLGYPLLGAYAIFHAPDSGSSGLKMFRFEFKEPDAGATMVREKVAMFKTIFDNVSKSYGPVTNGWMRVGSGDTVYDAPVQNGNLDTGTLLQVDILE